MYIRSMCMQICPVLPNTPNRAPSTTSSRLASGSTIIGFLPPSSRQAPIRFWPARWPTNRPVSVEPVNIT